MTALARDLDAATLALANAMAGTAASAAGAPGGLVPPPNGSWGVGAWFIDPQHGSDANSGLSSGSPLKTYARLTELWGTVAPLLKQPTVIQFLSAHTDNTDPVICKPYTSGPSAYCAIKGVRTLVASGALSGVVPKARTTPQLLEATLAAGLAAGQLVVNTTHAGEAMLYALASGTTWKVSQPVTLATLPPTLVQFEVNSWANGDAYEVFSLTNVNIVEFSPTTLDYDQTNLNNLSVLQDLVVWDPATLGEMFIRGGTIVAQNCGFTRHPNYDGQSNAQLLAFFQNCYIANACIFAGSDESTIKVMGGVVLSPVTPATFKGCTLDFDVVLGPGVVFVSQANTFGALYLETGTTLKLYSAHFEYEHATVGNDSIWGPGAISLRQSSLVIEPGSGVAVATLQLKGAITMDGLTTAYSVSGATLNPAIAITPANIDAAAGAAGFGGTAFSFAGSRITIDPNLA